MTNKLKPCPFCGEEAEIDDSGSCLDIICCCSMSIQKCDVLTIEQRKTLNLETYKYSDESEQIVLEYLIEKWNKRQ